MVTREAGVGTPAHKNENSAFGLDIDYPSTNLFRFYDFRTKRRQIMKIGDRVITKHGPGTIKKIEHFCDKFASYGILHDTFPVDMPRTFKDDILYYRKDEIQLAEDTKAS
jgi:hypothetical protein